MTEFEHFRLKGLRSKDLVAESRVFDLEKVSQRLFGDLFGLFVVCVRSEKVRKDRMN